MFYTWIRQNRYLVKSVECHAVKKISFIRSYNQMLKALIICKIGWYWASDSYHLKHREIHPHFCVASGNDTVTRSDYYCHVLNCRYRENIKSNGTLDKVIETMGILCRICQRVKWALLTLLIIGGASLLVFLHIEEYKQISHLAQEIGTFIYSRLSLIFY